MTTHVKCMFTCKKCAQLVGMISLSTGVILSNLICSLYYIVMVQLWKLSGLGSMPFLLVFSFVAFAANHYLQFFLFLDVTERRFNLKMIQYCSDMLPLLKLNQMHVQ